MVNPFQPPLSTYEFSILIGIHFFKEWLLFESLITDQRIFSLVIILLTRIPFLLATYGELLGENYCWSILGLKGLKHSVDNQGNVEGDSQQNYFQVTALFKSWIVLLSGKVIWKPIAYPLDRDLSSG